jgi:hypothetical protein
MTSLAICYDLRGDHVHCSVFVGRTTEDRGLAGTLVLRPSEFEDLARGRTTVEYVAQEGTLDLVGSNETTFEVVPRLPIDTAPRDGTEVLAWDRKGRASLIAWGDDLVNLAGNRFASGWYARALGEFILDDGYAFYPVYPVTWAPLPRGKKRRARRARPGR